MPRDFSHPDWPTEQEEQVRSWANFFLFIFGVIFVTAAIYSAQWVFRSEGIIDWNIPWWKCAILSYFYFVVRGVQKATATKE